MGLFCMWSDMIRGNISDRECIYDVVRTQGLIEKHNESLKDYVGEKNQRLNVITQQMYSYKISLQERMK